MPLLVHLKRALNLRPIIHDFKAAEKLWVDNVLNAPSKDIVELGKHVNQTIGSVRLQQVQPGLWGKNGQAAVASCKRNSFSRSSVIRYCQGSLLTLKVVAHEFVHAIQYRFRRLMIFSSLFFPSHRHALRAYREINGIVTDVEKGTVNQGSANQEIGNLLNNLSLKALKILKKINLLEIQAHTLTKRYSPQLQMTAEDIAQDKLNLDIFKDINRRIRRAERLKGGVGTSR
jgi:hypothetical protein